MSSAYQGHTCFACGGAGGDTVLFDKVVVWEACPECGGTGFCEDPTKEV